jgi:hypothetical protein
LASPTERGSLLGMTMGFPVAGSTVVSAITASQEMCGTVKVGSKRPAGGTFFERSRRRDLLSFDHHSAVATLDKRDQDWFLDCADTVRTPHPSMAGAPQLACYLAAPGD